MHDASLGSQLQHTPESAGAQSPAGFSDSMPSKKQQRAADAKSLAQHITIPNAYASMSPTQVHQILAALEPTHCSVQLPSRVARADKDDCLSQLVAQRNTMSFNTLVLSSRVGHFCATEQTLLTIVCHQVSSVADATVPQQTYTTQSGRLALHEPMQHGVLQRCWHCQHGGSHSSEAHYRRLFQNNSE